MSDPGGDDSTTPAASGSLHHMRDRLCALLGCDDEVAFTVALERAEAQLVRGLRRGRISRELEELVRLVHEAQALKSTQEAKLRAKLLEAALLRDPDELREAISLAEASSLPPACLPELQKAREALLRGPPKRAPAAEVVPATEAVPEVGWPRAAAGAPGGSPASERAENSGLAPRAGQLSAAAPRPTFGRAPAAPGPHGSVPASVAGHEIGTAPIRCAPAVVTPRSDDPSRGHGGEKQRENRRAPGRQESAPEQLPSRTAAVPPTQDWATGEQCNKVLEACSTSVKRKTGRCSRLAKLPTCMPKDPEFWALKLLLKEVQKTWKAKDVEAAASRMAQAGIRSPSALVSALQQGLNRQLELAGVRTFSAESVRAMRQSLGVQRLGRKELAKMRESGDAGDQPLGVSSDHRHRLEVGPEMDPGGKQALPGFSVDDAIIAEVAASTFDTICVFKSPLASFPEKARKKVIHQIVLLCSSACCLQFEYFALGGVHYQRKDRPEVHRKGSQLVAQVTPKPLPQGFSGEQVAKVLHNWHEGCITNLNFACVYFAMEMVAASEAMIPALAGHFADARSS